jgi:hypothetical protein
VVSKTEKRLTEREMWSLGDRNVLQKGRCGLQKRGKAYRKGDVVSWFLGDKNVLQKGRFDLQK